MALIKFRLGELEEKMRKAAIKEDFETAIILRDQARLLREKIAEEEANPQSVKVTELFTRQAYEHPEQGEQEDQEVLIDNGAIEMLQTAIKEYESGFRFGGILISGVRTPDMILRDAFTETSGPIGEHLTMFIGALDVAKADISEFMWLDEVEEGEI